MRAARSIYISQTDTELLQAYQRVPSDEIVAILFQRHMHRVLGLSLYYLHDQHLAEDAVMDVFETVLQKLGKQQVDYFEKWILAITRNHCLKLLTRSLKREKELIDKKTDPESVEFADELDLTQEDELIDHLDAALDELKDEQRLCVSLFYLKGLSYQEIEARTGYDNKQVKSYIQNGKLNLKKKLMNRR